MVQNTTAFLCENVLKSNTHVLEGSSHVKPGFSGLPGSFEVFHLRSEPKLPCKARFTRFTWKF